LSGFNYLSTFPDRRPAPKKHGASVGEFTDAFRRYTYVYESEPELAVLTLLISLPDVVNIREQVTVRYRWRGTVRKYTFDVVVRLRDGRRVAYATKRSERELLNDDTIEILEAIAAEHGSRVADEYRTVTYETLDPIALKNAKLIVGCGRDQDIAGQRRVREVLADLGPTVTLREVAEASGLGDRGVRAAVALIQSGILMPPRGQHLALDLPMENRGTRASASGNHSP
jgi:hypothetical protein